MPRQNCIANAGRKTTDRTQTIDFSQHRIVRQGSIGQQLPEPLAGTLQLGYAAPAQPLSQHRSARRGDRAGLAGKRGFHDSAIYDAQLNKDIVAAQGVLAACAVGCALQTAAVMGAAVVVEDDLLVKRLECHGR